MKRRKFLKLFGSSAALVNFTDFAELAKQWLVTKDVEDLAEFADNWLQEKEIAKISEIDFPNLRDLIDHSDLEFTRDSTAIVPHSGVEVGANETRVEPVTIASPVEVSTIEGKWVTGSEGEYLYAADGSDLYRSVDGENWSHFNDFGNTIRSMHITEQNTLMIGVNGGEVFRYDGQDWSVVLTVEVGQVVDFSWAEAAGHLVANEYQTDTNTPNNARRTYLSKDDGLSWEKIAEPPNIQDTPGQHAHTACVAVVDGEVVIYTSYGDGDYDDILKHTFDGTEWNYVSLKDASKMRQCPTSAVWIPERNVILWGNDGTGRRSAIVEHQLDTDTFNVISYSGTQVLAQETMGDNYVNYFEAINLGDIYLFTADHQADTRGGLWVSGDSKNWTQLFNTGVAGGRLFAIFRNRIYTGVRDDNITYYCDYPRVYTSRGLLVERENHNLLDSYDFTEWQVSDPDKVVIEDFSDSVDGRENVQIKWYTKEGEQLTSTDLLRVDTLQHIDNIWGTLSEDDWVFFNGWVKGRHQEGHHENSAFCQMLNSNIETFNVGELDVDDESRRRIPVDDYWHKFVNAVKVSENHESSRGRHWLQIRADSQRPAEFDGYTTDWNVECGQLCPASYQPRNVNRPHEVVSHSLAYSSEFTDIIAFAPTFDSLYLFGKAAGDYIFIKTYIEDTSNYMALVLDAYEKKIKLIDHTGAVAESSELEFYENTPMTVAVVRDGTFATLKVWTPQGYESDSGTIESLTLASVNYGSDANGENGGSFIFIRNRTYAEAFDSDNVKALMQLPKPEYSF